MQEASECIKLNTRLQNEAQTQFTLFVRKSRVTPKNGAEEVKFNDSIWDRNCGKCGGTGAGQACMRCKEPAFKEANKKDQANCTYCYFLNAPGAKTCAAPHPY